ncbi:85/ calcium-independent phospholipase A2 [Portunus trituberculatus]|uniref:85/ calcium-independent phospholipase A2 n=1 Tax=Portunus trituberculatus TaxID=210409 RepID=A0A5B7DQS2_PORTR|nr:85/ calcium-independent phospholipase A2 [Portunus trituberculatus]
MVQWNHSCFVGRGVSKHIVLNPYRAFGRFIDGGLISNNPTLDMLTEIFEYNTTLLALGRESEAVQPTTVISLGTGRPPVTRVDAIDCFKPESMWSTVQMAFGLSNIAKMLIDQATMADNRTVDRARAWCATCGIVYQRLSPQLSLDVQLDEKQDEILINALWETMILFNHRNDTSITQAPTPCPDATYPSS